MFKNLVKVILIAPLLVAFQCEDEMESTLRFNDFNVRITPQSSFSVNDTIWLNGIISSKVYDVAINDSIFNDIPPGDVLSIIKFIEPTQNSNCSDAIDKFELINEIGEISFLPICENAQMTVHSEISIDALSYVYRIGLKALETGDFVISWQDSKIKNENRNEYIIDNYPMEFHQNQIGFDKCGNVSWRYLNESEREYFILALSEKMLPNNATHIIKYSHWDFTKFPNIIKIGTSDNYKVAAPMSSVLRGGES